jgi:hypothetical protein
MKQVQLTDIQYDTDEEEVDSLPSEMTVLIPASITSEEEAEHFLSEHISNATGWCHQGFTVDPPLNTLYPN